MFAAGNSVAASEPNYIESVFSTYLYTGTGTPQTITNGIDLAGEGGLVWFKQRSAGGESHRLFDTVRGATKSIRTNATSAEITTSDTLTAFNSNGFNLGAGSGSIGTNTSASTYVSWAFRKQPKFFDIVTYTGDGTTNRTVAHNLGSRPGFIAIKRTDSTSNWYCAARINDDTAAVKNETAGDNFGFNSTDKADLGAWATVANTTTINLNMGGLAAASTTTTNINGATYVAYLFAHNAGGFGLTGTDNVISCGSVSATGSTLAEVNLGWEPQWLLIKGSNIINGWSIIDNMRGFTADKGVSWLQPNTSAAEVASPTTPSVYLTSTGFKVNSNEAPLNGTGTYIYIAIRRGPMAVPTLGTSVFSPVTRTGTGATANVTGVGFPPDLVIPTARTVGWQRGWYDRLRGVNKSIASNSTGAELTSADAITAFGQDGATYGAEVSVNASTYTFANWFMRRAPGFFDEVCYTGTGSATTFTHNLGVVPEFMIVKRRSTAEEWAVYPNVATKYLALNSTAASGTALRFWNDTTPTASVFTVGDSTWVNSSGATYVAYLFATCAGVSKVGSYTGTGALQTVACGFTSGARFVLIKRTDATGDWYVWDSARGITSGNDPYLLLNSTAAEVTSTNYVDTDTTGFKVTAAAPAALNASGGTFLFLAIA